MMTHRYVYTYDYGIYLYELLKFDNILKHIHLIKYFKHQLSIRLIIVSYILTCIMLMLKPVFKCRLVHLHNIMSFGCHLVHLLVCHTMCKHVSQLYT